MKHILQIAIVLLLGVTLSALGSCKNQSGQIKVADLSGDWSLDLATRDGQPTSTLENLFLDFNEKDSKVITNIFGSSDEYEFELIGKTISLEEGKFEFDIESLEDSVLVINMTINNTPFKMWFVK